jgi:hypothetical protein
LCTKVKNIAFDYWNETDKEWDEEWDTDSVENGNKLPPRVRIRLSVEDADGKVQEFQTQTEIVLQKQVAL